MTPRARALLPGFLLLLVALSVRQLWCAAPERVLLSGPAMGTTWSVTLVGADHSRDDVLAARAAIEDRLRAVEGLMSTWDADSELSRFNRHASTQPFALSPETFAVLELARQVSERSGGAFDVTVRPLVAAWGFGAGARVPPSEPDAAELAALRQRVGFALLELDAETRSARKLHPALEADLSAIAKGFAVDEVTRALAALGWSDFFVEVGGEVRVRGERPGGGGWRVGIERPDVAGREAAWVVVLRERALATSGDYRNAYERDGARRSHIIDPRSGRPVAGPLASVSVVHREAALADAWATALTVLGPDEGLALAEAEGLAAYFILRSAAGFETRATAGFPEVRDPHDGV